MGADDVGARLRATQRTVRKRRISPERPSIHRRDAENAEKRAASTTAPLRPLRLCGELQHVARHPAPTTHPGLTTEVPPCGGPPRPAGRTPGGPPGARDSADRTRAPRLPRATFDSPQRHRERREEAASAMAPLRTLHLCGELQHVAYEPTGANDVGARLRATQRIVPAYRTQAPHLPRATFDSPQRRRERRERREEGCIHHDPSAHSASPR
jgi:hypothetical protein